MVTIVETTTVPIRRAMMSRILEPSMMCAHAALTAREGSALPSGLGPTQGGKAGVEGAGRCPSLLGCDDRMGQ